MSRPRTRSAAEDVAGAAPLRAPAVPGEVPPFARLPDGMGRRARAAVEVREAVRTRGLGPLVAAAGRVLPAPRRRLHLFGVGAPKTGTHSLAALFERDYAVGHEAASFWLMGALARRFRGDLPDGRARALLRGRDRLLRLEVDVAHQLHHVVELLVEAFPAARFVLTVREPVSWLASEVNECAQRYSNTGAARRTRLRMSDHRYGRYGLAYAPEEAALRAFGGVYPVEAALRYWADHNRRVLEAVPPDRLLVVPTTEIGARVEAIAAFAGVDPATLDAGRSRAYVRHEKAIDVRALVPADWLAARAEAICGPLAARLLP